MKPATLKILKEINESVPKQWFDMLTRKIWAYPAIRQVVDRGLIDPEVEETTKIKLRLVKMSEEYSATEDVVNPDIEKKIDEHITRKVRQAIKKGLLPPLSKEETTYVRKPKIQGN